MTGNELQRLSDATRALAEVSTAAGAWELARTAEAARRYAQMKGLGHEAVNYATGIKAKAMILLAGFIDEGQHAGTVATADHGRPKKSVDNNHAFLRDVLGTETPQQARDAVRQARSLREALGAANIDELVKEANESGDDLGIRGLKRMAAEKREPEPVNEPVPLPDGVFPCIVIDPPWPMQKIERDERPVQGVALDYPVMSLDELAKLPVSEKAADDAHLYLWVTHKFLPAGLDLLETWGFHYQCVMTWRKNVGITPFSWMYDTEHVLFARRGGLPLTQLGLRLSFDAPVAGHSVKPDVFYDRVRNASPGPRLEMFARRKRDGFTPWGNEVRDA
jgi:N6-adenosine-specific RNA methylase IME4